MTDEAQNSTAVEQTQADARLAAKLEKAMKHELRHVRDKWWWALLLGVGLFVLGLAALATAPFLASVVFVVLLGFLMLVGGVAQLVSAFWAGKWSGFLLELLIGILYVVIGILIIDEPVETLVVLTVLIAAFLIVGGIFRIVSAMSLQFPGWGWHLLNGFVSLLLGVLILQRWPESSLVVIGVFVGIEMIFNGLTWAMLGLELRRLPEVAEETPGDTSTEGAEA
jgi:uncharacterized membrane protein HdeD (DUF308 family)